MNSNVLNASSNAELLSYIINVTPVLHDNLDLPVQGQSVEPLGKIIMGNKVYRNAFINTINLIGLTVIKRNGWSNPWEWFTNKGTLRFGQHVREMIVDLANVYDYNLYSNDNDRFLDTVVPNVLSYIHEVNFQKFYQTTTSDEQMAMAFTEEQGLLNLIYEIVGSLYESFKYDDYIVNKYMLCRRILDGTMTPVYLSNLASGTTREVVSAMKSAVNKMAFRNPNYNPAGIRKANRLEDLILIMNTDFEAKLSTEVLATSFFRSDAELKTNGVLCDGFGSHDTARLTELLGDQYTAFTDAELSALSAIPAVVISKDWFMDYTYQMDSESDMKQTEFYNPVTLKANHFLHVWKCYSTSPYEQGAVYTGTQPSVTSVSVSPATASVMAGQSIQLSATVVTTGFANKAVVWTCTEGATIDQNGKLSVPADTELESITVTATSVFDDTEYDTATITVISEVSS